MFCANCQRLLPQGQTVCSYCEGEIRALPAVTWKESSYPASPVPDMGFFTCPACNKRFDECVQIDIPSPRWNSSRLSDACPHCKTRLQWEPLPQTLPLQRRLAVVASAGSLALLVFYAFTGAQAIFGITSDSYIAKALQITVFISPYLIGLTTASREDKMLRLQGRYRSHQEHGINMDLIAWALFTLSLYTLLLFLAPSAWVAEIFVMLLAINIGTTAWLLLLNWRQRRQMAQRAQALP